MQGTSGKPWAHRRSAAPLLLVITVVVLHLLHVNDALRYFFLENNLGTFERQSGQRDDDAATMLETILSSGNVDPAIHLLHLIAKELYVNLDSEQQQLITAFANKLARAEGDSFADFDWTVFPVGCGTYKCFWPSVSNSSQGYLLARGKGETLLDTMTETFQFEQHLVETYGIRPTNLGPPGMLNNISSPVEALLKAYGMQGSPPYAIQRVLKIPEPNLLIHQSRRDTMKLRRDVPEFAKLIAANNKTEQFAQQFHKEIQTLTRLLQERRDLLHDFQVVTTLEGELYHLDLDRARNYWLVSKNGEVNPERYDIGDGINKESYNVTLKMESIQKILNWLTRVDINLTELHDSILFQRGWMPEWEATPLGSTPQLDSELQADDQIFTAVLKKFLATDNPIDSWEKALVVFVEATAEQEGLPWSDINWQYTMDNKPDMCTDTICYYPSKDSPANGYAITRVSSDDGVNDLSGRKIIISLPSSVILTSDNLAMTNTSKQTNKVLMALSHFKKSKDTGSHVLVYNATQITP